MSTKKILFIYGVYSIHAEKRVKVFLDDPRFEVAIISRHDYSFNGINCFKLNDYRDDSFFEEKSKLLRGIVYFKQLFKHYYFIKNTIKLFKPDIIFLQTLLYPAFLTFGIKKKYKIAITFWNGDVTWWAKWDFVEKLFKYSIVKNGIKNADLITVNSNYAKECCKRYFYNYDKIKVITYPGVNRNIFYSKKNYKVSLQKKFNVNSKYLFFCPRGLASYLNNDHLLNAFSQLKNTIDFTAIFLLGNASILEVENFNLDIKKYGLTNNIRTIENLSPIDMSEFYSMSDITISLSSNDSLPNCMLESMSCGTVVLMGDIPQIREWIKDGENGILCEIGNIKELTKKILYILNEPILVEKMVIQAEKLIEERANFEKSVMNIKHLILDL
jgi:glycosyltransferase involved in cell wall biosynthesis